MYNLGFTAIWLQWCLYFLSFFCLACSGSIVEYCCTFFTLSFFRDRLRETSHVGLEFCSYLFAVSSVFFVWEVL